MEYQTQPNPEPAGDARRPIKPRPKPKAKAGNFLPAPSVRVIGEELIRQYHTHLLEHDIRVEYAFLIKGKTKGPKVVLGTARKVGSYAAFLAGKKDEKGGVNQDPFFLIEIAEARWRNLTDKQKIALVDHELCHCGVEINDDDEIVLKLIPHDLEEFRPVVERNGLWKSDLQDFAEACEEHLPQLRLEIHEGAA